VISAYFDSIQFGARRNQLVIYALVTAFFSAGTVVSMMPRQMGLGEMLFGTILYGPLHLLVAFGLEYVVQLVYSKGRRLVDRDGESSKTSFTLFALFAFFAWISLMLGVPFGYKSCVMNSVNNEAIERANNDWRTNALIFRDDQFIKIGSCTVQYDFDPETGLQLEHRRPDLGSADRYNARISELIELHGIPSYSIKSIMPHPEDLIRLLDSTEMSLVESFPFDLTENIHLMRRGTLTRWGGTSTSESYSLSIATPHSLMGDGGGVMPVHTKITKDVIYIRNGSNWIGAFLPDGRMIMSASR
jgi:hypothetical protein